MSADPLVNQVETAEAMHRALVMTHSERSQRAEILRSIVEGHRVGDWLHDQLLDLSRLQGGKQAARE